MAKPKRKRPGTRTPRPGAAPAPAAPPEDPTPGIKSSALFGGLRLAALMSATIIALLVFSLLQKPLGFWPALIVGFVAGILARAALLWVERIWLRAVVRRARSRQAEQSGNGS